MLHVLLLTARVGAATVYGGATLPLLAPGATLIAGGDEAVLERTFRIGAPGVWYLWVQASTPGPNSVLLTWDLDGLQPLHSGRAQMLLRPYSSHQWTGASRYPQQRAMVHVDTPGEHTLHVTCLEGRTAIDRVALTLHFSASPAGDTLDHASDPGGGRAVFPMGDLTLDGFREDRPAPEPTVRRRFYVDGAHGDDRHDGLAPGRAWRTLARVAAHPFRPGDAVLFRRGGRWEGGLTLSATGGTAADPIVLGAFGDGPRPRLNGLNRNALSLYQVSHAVIRDLTFTSDPAYGWAGLSAVAAGGRPRPVDLTIRNVVAFDNGGPGISVANENGQAAGYDTVLIENCLAFCNGAEGINVYGRNRDGCRNVVVRFCTAWENRGSPGAGIMVSSGQNGLIERCVAYNNVSINIWTWNAVNVTIRDCEAFRGHESDAGGFDLDFGTDACVIERCYAHHNEGPGFLLMGSGTAFLDGFSQTSEYDLLRYAVAEDNGDPIPVDQTFRHGIIHNCLSLARGPRRSALGLLGSPLKPNDASSGGWPSDCAVFNNLLIGLGGACPLYVDDFAATQGNAFDHDALLILQDRGPIARWGGRFNGSNYWTGEGPDDAAPPKAFDSLAGFAGATGQERHGIALDPGFPRIAPGSYGRLPLAGYELPAGSPAAHAGQPPTLPPAWLSGRAALLTETGAAHLGIPMAPAPVVADYRGKPLPPGGAVSIGPFEP